MPKRNDPWDSADAEGQAKHRPDKSVDSRGDTSGKKRTGTKRDRQDQLNVLIRKGNAKRFRMKAMNEDTTMSALVDQWVAEYLAGKR